MPPFKAPTSTDGCENSNPLPPMTHPSVTENTNPYEDRLSAMENFKNAAQSWSLKIRNSDFEIGENLMERTMQIAWAKASANIRNAENLLR
jgi:hypothetical protein